MENIENLLQIYEQLRSCTDPDEVEMLKKSLKGSIHIKKMKKESDRDSCKNGGSKELGIRNVGRSRMLSVADKDKEVDNLTKEVKELADIGKFGDDLTIEVHEEMQVKFPTSELVGEMFERYMHVIPDLLTKNKASTIGVWGMGGVGKTTLIMHLHNKMVAQPHIHGSIYWITVSKDCSIQKLQNDIAKRIGKSISHKLDELIDESLRARILAEALERKKKFVLILDDMWSDFDLSKVGLGIPKEFGYRLIVTSRSKDVCSKMYCDNIIKVNPLSEKDAWTLFVRSIGHEISDDLTKISTDVLKECAGLPLGIITLAKSMIGCNDVCEWRNVLEELRNSSGKIDDMEEKVFNVLRLSYERLKVWEIKECLLYCATYPEDCRIEIDELIWLFIDTGLLGKNIGIAKMFDKGLAILKKLERAALLSIDRRVVHNSHLEEKELVHLHDLIRDMTLHIAGSRFMIKAGIGLKTIPGEESWTEQLKVVSLMRNQFKEISNSPPKCNRLTTLLLQRNYVLSMVCDGFFKHLDVLKLLELSNSKIRTLPESISLLKNLTALILRSCVFFKNVPSLAKLTSLERLDLYGTRIEHLPKGIGNLIKLRYLNLFNTEIRRINVGVISKLSVLQYLSIDARIEVKELNSLNNLEHLSVQFVDFASFSTFIEQMKIKGRPNSYMFKLGNERLDLSDYMSNQLSEKRMYLRHTRHMPHENIMMSFVDFDLDKVRNERESMVSNVQRYNQLLKILFGNSNRTYKRVRIMGSPGMERVKLFCENEIQKVFQDIHLLDIHNGEDLRSLGDFIFDSMCNLQRRSKIEGIKPFSNLKSLKLDSCQNLKEVFPLGVLSNFQNMEEIIVDFCEELEELIESAADETKSRGIGHLEILSLPKLKFLVLHDLPNLLRLCSDDSVIRTPFLQWISIRRCGKLKRMSVDVDNQHQPCPQMFYFEKEKGWVESLEWDPHESKKLFDENGKFDERLLDYKCILTSKTTEKSLKVVEDSAQVHDAARRDAEEGRNKMRLRDCRAAHETDQDDGILFFALLRRNWVDWRRRCSTIACQSQEEPGTARSKFTGKITRCCSRGRRRILWSIMQLQMFNLNVC